MAKAQAHAYCRNAPAGIDGDAIEGAALEALVRAARSYNQEKGASFEAWASTRVWWAIRDEVRRLEGNSRGAVKRACQGSSPLAREVSLFAPIGEDGLTLADTLTSDRDEIQLRVDLLHALSVFRSLPERLRIILARSARGDSGQEIAQDLGITESRVSQLRTKAAEML